MRDTFRWVGRVLRIAAGLLALGSMEIRCLAEPLFPPQDPLPAGERLLGVALSEGEVGFGTAFQEGQKAGVQIVELNLPWDMFEKEEGRYEDPFGLLQAIAHYGAHQIQVSFSLAVINTSQRTVPPYLKEKRFSDPEMIAAFKRFADWFLGEVPENITVASFSVGNEVDLYLQGAKAWKDYIGFVEPVIAHLRKGQPKIRYGVKTTFKEGVIGGELEQVRAVNAWSDVIMLNLYAQNDAFKVDAPEAAHAHLAKMVEAFPKHPIWLTELGYQSGGTHCGSSPERQAAFYHEFFQAWDTHRDRIGMVMINWLHDQPARQVEEWTKYYGSDAPAFVEFLSTLGLRSRDGKDKPAWTQVRAEAKARGW